MSWHSVSMPSNGSALPVSIRETMPKVDQRKLRPLQRDVLAVDVVQLLFYSTFALYSKPLLMLSVSICYFFSDQRNDFALFIICVLNLSCILETQVGSNKHTSVLRASIYIFLKYL